MNTYRDGRVVVITGGSAGIGRAAAVRFARAGCDVAVLARGEQRLQETCEELTRLGVRPLGISTDVADPDAVERAAEEVEAKLGPIDVWVNNAVNDVFAPAVETTADEYRRVTEVCYLGYVHGTLSALKRMRPRDRGHLIFVGSAVAYRGIPLQAAYSGAKHAIQGFFDSLRAELRHDQSRVRLTMVQMPAVNTPRFSWSRSKLPRKAQPLPPIYQPEIAADAIYFASTTNRREIWVGGSTVLGILGNRLMPGLVDRYLARKGYEGQMTWEMKPRSQQDNLYEAAKGSFGAHGEFDDRSSNRSAQLWATMHRGTVGFTTLTIVGLVGALCSAGVREALAGLAPRRSRTPRQRLRRLAKRMPRGRW